MCKSAKQLTSLTIEKADRIRYDASFHFFFVCIALFNLNNVIRYNNDIILSSFTTVKKLFEGENLHNIIIIGTVKNLTVTYASLINYLFFVG